MIKLGVFIVVSYQTESDVRSESSLDSVGRLVFIILRFSSTSVACVYFLYPIPGHG